jgi:hypothetical protein
MKSVGVAYSYTNKHVIRKIEAGLLFAAGSMKRHTSN